MVLYIKSKPTLKPPLFWGVLTSSQNKIRSYTVKWIFSMNLFFFCEYKIEQRGERKMKLQNQ
jgi:hypothetical protein